MAKIALSALACFFLISLVQGGDVTGFRRSALAPPPKKIAAPSALQTCQTMGYTSSCWGLSDYVCGNLRCVNRHNQVISVGKAPEHTWCETGKTCRNGRCLPQTLLADPENNVQQNYAWCPSPPRPRGS